MEGLLAAPRSDARLRLGWTALQRLPARPVPSRARAAGHGALATLQHRRIGFRSSGQQRSEARASPWHRQAPSFSGGLHKVQTTRMTGLEWASCAPGNRLLLQAPAGAARLPPVRAVARGSEVAAKEEMNGETRRGGQGGVAESEGAGDGEMGSSIADFTRFYEDPQKNVVELQTAIVTYWKRGPWWDVLRPEVQVDLVSVVHIGDPEYYEGLQEELYTYDRVLYEMVSEKKPKPGSAVRRNPRKGVSLFGGKRRGTLKGTSSESYGLSEEGYSSEEGDCEAPEDSRAAGAQAESTGRTGRRRTVRGTTRTGPGTFLRRSVKFGRRGRRRGFSIVGFIQRFMARALQLSFQLDHIDYLSPNFLNADLDFGTFTRLQKERKESIFSIAKEVSVKSTRMVMATMEGAFQDPAMQEMSLFKRVLFWASRSVPMPLVGLLLIDSVCRPPGTSTAIATQPAVRALLNLDVSSALKVFLAQQMSSDALDTAASVMEQSVIVGERNKAAMVELHQALDDGCRRIAIFYGSAHLPDLHRRLKNELGLEPVDVQWRTAWSIIGRRSQWLGGDNPMESYFSALRESGSSGSGVLHNRRRRLRSKEERSSSGSWPLTRSQTIALLLLSLVLAVDLWLWELLFEGVEEVTVQVVVFVANILDKGWSL